MHCTKCNRAGASLQCVMITVQGRFQQITRPQFSNIYCIEAYKIYMFYIRKEEDPNQGASEWKLTHF